jgi:hypothetical protein
MNGAKSALDLAQQAYDEKRSSYLSCVEPAKRSELLITAAQPVIAELEADAGSIRYMNDFLVGYLDKDVSTTGTRRSLKELAVSEQAKLADEIQRLKAEIGTERRRFLDSGPQVSPAIAGLYFTRVPDNQVLIAFIVCLVAFLLLSGGAIIRNIFGIQYIATMTIVERLKVVGVSWGVSLIVVYLGFILFS